MQENENFEEMLNESLKPQKSFELGDRIETVVSGIDKESIYLDISPRIQGIVNKNEFIENGELTVSLNDKITVYVIGKSKGFFKCAKRLGTGSNNNNSEDDTYTVALREAYENEIPVEGKITKVIKGGFEVTIMGKKTFCPISQIDTAYCEEPEKYLNKSFTFMIVEYKEDKNDFIISRKEYLLRIQKLKADELWKNIKENDVYEGVVTMLKPYGAFVDIGGIEGLLHISEISHDRISDASEKLKKDDKVRVEVINIDTKNRKIGLSVKSLTENPKKKKMEELSEGITLQGTVVRLKPFGAFINLFPGIDGLLHISKLGVNKRVDHPKEVLSINDIVKVRILELDRESGKISLTMEEAKYDFNEDLNKIKKEQEKLLQSQGTMADLFKDL